jgi:GNAT superfamily N-acetyltransferase
MENEEAGTKRFHQKLRAIASKVFVDKETATIASFDNRGFVCIKSLSDFPGVSMIQAIYVAEKERGKGLAKHWLNQIVVLAESEGEVLGAYTRPFEIKHPRKTIEQAVLQYTNDFKYFIDDWDGSKAKSIRKILKETGFESGFDCQTKHDRYNLFWTFHNLHCCVPMSLAPEQRQEFYDNYSIDTQRPSMMLLSKMCKHFDLVGDSTYKLPGRDAFVKISGVSDNAIFSSSVVRIAFVSGKDAQMALTELQVLAQKCGCSLVGVVTPTPPPKRFKFRKNEYRQLLENNGFDRHCPDAVLGDDCCGYSDFQIIWLPSTVDPNLELVVKLLTKQQAA